MTPQEKSIGVFIDGGYYAKINEALNENLNLNIHLSSLFDFISEYLADKNGLTFCGRFRLRADAPVTFGRKAGPGSWSGCPLRGQGGVLRSVSPPNWGHNPSYPPPIGAYVWAVPSGPGKGGETPISGSSFLG